VKLSVVLVTRNEAHLLEECLSRLGFEDELIVLDMQSTDESVAIAERFGARVVTIEPDPFVVRVRNIGLDEAAGEWVLYLDPDEYVPPGFGDALRAGLEHSDAAAYYMPFRTMGFGRTLYYGDVQEEMPRWWSSPGEHDENVHWPAKLCLFRASHARWPDECTNAHVEPVVDGRVDRWHGEPIEHHCFRDVPQMMEKMTRYNEAADSAQWGDKPLTVMMPFKTLYQHMVTEKWWRDGSAGVALALLFTMRDWQRALRLWEEGSWREAPVANAATRSTMSGLELLQDVTRSVKTRLKGRLSSSAG